MPLIEDEMLESQTLTQRPQTNAVSQKILLQLIADRTTMMKEGGGGRKDIMSHILRAGLVEDESAKLTDYEIVSELRSVHPSLPSSLPSLSPPLFPRTQC
jgi:hypothetical protein